MQVAGMYKRRGRRTTRTHDPRIMSPLVWPFVSTSVPPVPMGVELGWYFISPTDIWRACLVIGLSPAPHGAILAVNLRVFGGAQVCLSMIASRRISGYYALDVV